MKRFVSFILIALMLAAAMRSMLWAEPASDHAKRTSTSVEPRGPQIRHGESRYDWQWIAKTYDKNEDGAVTRDEIGAPPEVFARLDRTWDGTLTPTDFDWTAEAPLDQQKETAFALFRAIDSSSDGHITAEEWQAAFAKVAAEKGYLNDEDLALLVYRPRAQRIQKQQEMQVDRLAPAREAKLRDTAGPRPGDIAPDFKLRTPDGESVIQLSAHRGKKPVVLIFGCYTCGPHRTQSGSLEAIYQRWKDEAEFIRVYMQEAHPVDGWRTPANDLVGIKIKQPVTFEERCGVAQTFVSALQLETPVVVDEIDNHVSDAYAAWPDRLYVVDREGKIAYRGGPGPFAFNPAELEQSLLLLLLDEQSGETAGP